MFTNVHSNEIVRRPIIITMANKHSVTAMSSRVHVPAEGHRLRITPHYAHKMSAVSGDDSDDVQWQRITITITIGCNEFDIPAYSHRAPTRVIAGDASDRRHRNARASAACVALRRKALADAKAIA